MTVPITALRSAAATDAPSVSFSAATDCGLETTSQKPCAPSFVDSQTRAAIGSATRIVR